MAAETFHLTGLPLMPNHGRGENIHVAHWGKDMPNRELDPYQVLRDRVADLVGLILLDYPDLRNKKDDLTQEVTNDLARMFEQFRKHHLGYWDRQRGTRTAAEILRQLERLLTELGRKGSWEDLDKIKDLVRGSIPMVRARNMNARRFARLTENLDKIDRMSPNVLYTNTFLRQKIRWKVSDFLGGQKERAQQEEPLDAKTAEEKERVLRQVGPTPASPEHNLALKTTWRLGLAKLDATTRRVVVMVSHGHTQPEIAQCLDISLSNVERRLRQGRKILEETLREGGLNL